MIVSSPLLFGGRPVHTFMLAKAKEAATKALELDNRLAEAHTTLAYRTTHHDFHASLAGRPKLRVAS